MLPDFVLETLKHMGGAGAVILVLLGAISGLITAIVYMYRRDNRIYGYRLTERDTIANLANAGNVAIASSAKAMEENNELTEELADATSALATKLDYLTNRLEMQHILIMAEHRRHDERLDGINEAARIYNQAVIDIRSFLQQFPPAPTRRR
jgi:hypothetical protein